MSYKGDEEMDEDAQKEINKLRKEVERLRKEKEQLEPVVIPPADYDRQKRELQRTREEVKKLRRLINSDRRSPLSVLLTKYMEYSKVELKRLGEEVNLSDFEKNDVEQVMNFIEYLYYVGQELYSLIAMSVMGKYADNEAYRACELMRTQIVDLMGSQDFLGSISDKKYDEVYHICKAFYGQITKFVNDEDGYADQ